MNTLAVIYIMDWDQNLWAFGSAFLGAMTIGAMVKFFQAGSGIR